jgi:holo-[acyl-carrier protein] synthase
MIHGVGVDMVPVDRFRDLDAKEDFLREVFLSSEIQRAPPEPDLDSYFAALFAVKEAFLKGLGLGLSEGFRWRDLEVTADRRLRVSGTLGDLIHKTGIGKVHVTVSSTDDHAVAFVILETQSGDQVP